jgi:hypothetical protein
MMSERMQARYEEAYELFEKTFGGTGVHIRHRSLKKYENNTNQDVNFYINDQYICGMRVARNSYKFYLDNDDWYKTTKGELSERKDDGWYSVIFENLDDCAMEMRAFFRKEYSIK